jgi:dolichol-phosphate mannosyltransferase
MTSVSVIIPAYNEGAAFACSLVTISEYFALHHGAGYDFHYVIVNDGSGDETYEVARAFAHRHRNVSVLQHSKNRGLGAALRTAFASVTTEIAVVLDADLSYSPATCMRLIEALEGENADLALASPYMRGGAVANVPPLRRILSRNANRLLSLAVSGRISTLTCMVRAYRVPALKRLTFTSDGMDAVAEHLLCAVRLKFDIVEIPATLRWSEERRSAGNRVRLSRVAAQAWATVRMAFSHRPTLWLAVPGLFPGLLPLVVAVLLFLHVRPAMFAAATLVTVIVQYTSLAVFAGQVGTVFARGRFRRRHPRRSKDVTPHDYDVPARTA